MGRLTQDPALATTTSGKKVVTFTLAIDRDRTKEDTDFIDFVAWEGRAEFVSRYFRKGKLMLVTGPLHHRKYTNKNGEQKDKWEVIALEIYFCDNKPQDTGWQPTRTTQDVIATDFSDYNSDEQLPF